MGASRPDARGAGRGQWGTFLLTAAATVGLLAFQLLVTCAPGGVPEAETERPDGGRPAGSSTSAGAPALTTERAGAASSGARASTLEPPVAPGGAALALEPPAAPRGAVAPPARPPALPPARRPLDGLAVAVAAPAAGARADGAGPGERPESARPGPGSPGSLGAAVAPVLRPARPGAAWLAADEAYRRERAGDLRGAAAALDRALALGYRPQAGALDRAGLARALDDRTTERALLARAAAGRDPVVAARARAQLRAAWIREGWRRRTAGDLAGARAAFDAARAAGVDAQRLGVELAYLDLASGDREAARTRLLAAADGGDPAIAGEARAQLAALPRRLHLDLYSELVSWRRAAGPDPGGATVPMLRLRALWRPSLDHGLELYAFAQGTRELGPIAIRGGAPVLHADDAAIAGGGVLLRGLGGHAGLFAQAGSAVETAPGRAGRTALDVRAGGFLDASAGRCWPAPADGLRRALDPCAEGYGEVTYVNRFHDDVFALGRLRAGVTLLVAGPVALGLVSEARAAASRNGHWYDQLADAGAGIRARLLAPFHLDLSVTGVVGRYLGSRAAEPPPPRWDYADLRVQAVTYLEF